MAKIIKALKYNPAVSVRNYVEDWVRNGIANYIEGINEEIDALQDTTNDWLFYVKQW